MSTTLEWMHDGLKLEIAAAALFGPADPQLVAFVRALEALRAAANLAQFTLTRDSPVPGPQGLQYTYYWTTKDGRAWTNHMRIGAQVLVDFATDFFILEEYLPSLQLRQNVVVLIHSLGITSVEATW